MTQKQLDLSIMALSFVSIITAGVALVHVELRTVLIAFTLASLGLQTIFYAYTFLRDAKKRRGMAISFAGGFSLGWSIILLVL